MLPPWEPAAPTEEPSPRLHCSEPSVSISPTAEMPEKDAAVSLGVEYTQREHQQGYDCLQYELCKYRELTLSWQHLMGVTGGQIQVQEVEMFSKRKVL